VDACLIIHCFDEDGSQIFWCLESIRRCYISEELPVKLIFDGGPDHRLPLYRGIAALLDCQFIHGDHLKQFGTQARWWERFFSEGVLCHKKYIIKFDPDTCMHHRFEQPLPDGDYFGTFGSGRDAFSRIVNGGCQGFSTIAAINMLDSGLLRDPCYDQPETHVPEWRARGLRRENYWSTDWSIMHITERMMIPRTPWPEVQSWCPFRENLTPPPRPQCEWAVTHPHKVNTRMFAWHNKGPEKKVAIL
jgi:hypothetical protein